MDKVAAAINGAGGKLKDSQLNRRVNWKKMRKSEKISDTVKRAMLTFVYQLVVFVTVIESFCYSISQGIRECLLLSTVYYFPLMWLITFSSGEFFRRIERCQDFLAKRYHLVVLILSLVYVMALDALAFTNVINIGDFNFAGVIVSIYLITMSLLANRTILITRG